MARTTIAKLKQELADKDTLFQLKVDEMRKLHIQRVNKLNDELNEVNNRAVLTQQQAQGPLKQLDEHNKVLREELRVLKIERQRFFEDAQRYSLAAERLRGVLHGVGHADKIPEPNF